MSDNVMPAEIFLGSIQAQTSSNYLGQNVIPIPPYFRTGAISRVDIKNFGALVAHFHPRSTPKLVWDQAMTQSIESNLSLEFQKKSYA